MPKDTWKRANARANYGPARSPKSSKSGKGKTHLPARKRHRLRRPRGPGAWSRSTVLWFGVHKGKPVHKVPLDYLRWLATQTTSTSPNVAALAAWLRSEHIPTLETAVTPTTCA